MLNRALLAAAVVALFALASCAGFTFETQEIALRSLPEEDALEILLVYEGVTPDGEEPADLERAVRALTGIAEGRRHVILLGWPFELDLDGEFPAADDPAMQNSASARRLLDYVEHLELREVGLSRNGERLTLHQRLRFGQFRAGLELLNTFLGEYVLELEQGVEEEWIDAQSIELWIEHARAGRDWIVFDERGLELHIPASSVGAARWLRGLCAAMVEAGREGLEGHRVLDQLAELTFDDELLTARFGVDDAGIVRFVLPLRPASDARDLIEALEKAEVRTSSADAPAQARRAFADF